MTEKPTDIERIINAWHKGDATAFEALISLVYDELKILSHKFVSRESDWLSLETSDILHEALISLAKKGEIDWQEEAHFFKIAARSIWRAIMKKARKTNASKRGSGVPTVSLEEGLTLQSGMSSEELIALDHALVDLAELDNLAVEVVMLRFCAGFTVKETADILDVSEMTVKRKWSTARAWLHTRVIDSQNGVQHE